MDKYSNYSLLFLKKIANYYNREYNKNICTDCSRSKLLQTLYNLYPECNHSDACLLKDIKDKQLYNFIYEHTFNGVKRELKTNDIDYVMKKYQKIYNDFYYLGTMSSDFDVQSVIQKIIKSSKKRIAMIMNTDPSYKPGQHWIAIFFEKNKKELKIDYYDSFGINMVKQLKPFIQELQKHFEIDLTINQKRQQYSKTECGVYSIYFILSKLENKTMKQIVKHNISENQILKIRKKIIG